MRLKLIILVFGITFFVQAQKGTISGKILDKEMNNEPLPFADIIIKGTKIGTTSNDKGEYTLNVDAGKVTVVYSFLGYKTQEVVLQVKEGKNTVHNQTLGSDSMQLKDVVVVTQTNREKETALLMEQKKAVVIKQSIGAQELSRKGVSNVEEGLTKITGFSKVESRGLFVRGLEDRYNNMLINGLAVPSNSPFKKIVPLDNFPTDIVSVIETYKTFNSNLYGDFAGGTFNIVTSTGVKSQTKISFGTGFTTNNNFSKFLISKDATSTNDFFGFPKNERDLPAIFGSTPAYLELTSAQSKSSFGSGYDVKETNSPLNTSFGISHSDKFNIGKGKLKYIFSINFDNNFQIREGVNRFFNTQQGNYDNNLYFKQYKYSTNGSTLFSLNYSAERLNFTTMAFYLKTTENTIQDQLGSTNGTTVNTNAFIRLNELQDTDYLITQLFGDYKLSKDERHNLKFGGSYTSTNYQLPDRKSFKGVKIDDNTTAVSYSGNSLYRQYTNFDGKLYASGLAEYSWKFSNEDIDKSHKLTIGYNGFMNSMESSVRFLTSVNKLSNSLNFQTNLPDSFFANELDNNGFVYSEGSNSIYKAKLDESVNAGYFDLAFKFGEKINLNLGARAEKTNRKTSYKEPGSFDQPFIIKKVDNLDISPSVNFKYQLNEKSNFRFAGSRTITRPVLMEAYPLEFVNPDGTIEQGNPNLKNSVNINIDLKYELYPSAKELFTATLFSKIIQDPIERVFIPTAGSGGQIISYDNSEKATLIGGEFEYLLDLKRISKNLENFTLGLNTTLMYSKVDINTINSSETVAIGNSNPSRELQGASPWIVNADIKYEFEFSENWKNTLSLVYNVYGKRIFAVGTGGLDHYYEMPFNKLDFIWSNKIGKNWDLKLSADNLLNPLYQIKMGDESKLEITENDLTIRNFKRGIGFSFNLSYSF